MTNLYSGVFFDNGLHMTFDWSPGMCELPEGIQKGDEQIVTLYASVHTQSIGLYACFFQMEGRKLYDQKDEQLPLHITLYTGVTVDDKRKRIPRSEAGVFLRSCRRLLPKGTIPTGYSPLTSLYTWKGEWNYYIV